MPFLISHSIPASKVLAILQRNNSRKYKKVINTLGLLSRNSKHPGLNSHKVQDVTVPGGEEVWESYVENETPGAWRVFWYYGPDTGTITVFAITPHP